MSEFKSFINGSYRESGNNNLETITDPATGEILGKAHIPSESDIADAASAARHALNGPWKDWDANQRSEALIFIGEKIKERRKEFVDWEIKDSGSVARKAKADIHNAASFFKVMGKTVAKFEFQQVDERASREGFSKNYRNYLPVGVCAQIIPWNFPLVMAAWKLGPVIASGSTTVLKSALETPITASLLGDIMNEAGIPAGVVNIITGDAQTGKTLLSRPEIQKVSFTGSTNVGKEILKNAAPGILRSTLELGGKSPNIVLNDADIDCAVDGALYAFCYHQGQACDSGTRLLVQDGIYDQFVEKLISRAKDIKIGPPNDMSSGMGPVINEKQFNTINNYIETTKKEGGKLLHGGNRLTGGAFDTGYYLEPAFFEIDESHTIFHEEIFGPVVGITKFKSEDEAIKLANNSRYGLAGAVWSKDHERAKNLSRQLAAGTVWINEYHLLNPGMPFGGFKESGLGREMGAEGLKAYLEVQHLWESDCDNRDQKPWFDALF